MHFSEKPVLLTEVYLNALVTTGSLYSNFCVTNLTPVILKFNEHEVFPVNGTRVEMWHPLIVVSWFFNVACL